MTIPCDFDRLSIWRALRSEASSCRKRDKSTANWRIFVWESMPLSCESCLITSASFSTANIKRNGEMGHPCLIPRSKENQPELMPQFKIHDSEELYKSLIHVRKVSPKWKVSRALKRNWWPIESKAAAKSSETKRPDLSTLATRNTTVWNTALLTRGEDIRAAGSDHQGSTINRRERGQGNPQFAERRPHRRLGPAGWTSHPRRPKSKIFTKHTHVKLPMRHATATDRRSLSQWTVEHRFGSEWSKCTGHNKMEPRRQPPWQISHENQRGTMPCVIRGDNGWFETITVWYYHHITLFYLRNYIDFPSSSQKLWTVSHSKASFSITCSHRQDCVPSH